MRKFIKFSVVGSSLVIPGVCSASTAIILGVYDEMLLIFSNIFKISKIKENIVSCLGILVGVIIGLSLIKLLYDVIPFILNITFLSFIICNIPYKLTTCNKISKLSYSMVFLVGFCLVMLLSNLNSNLVDVDGFGVDFKVLVLIGISGVVASISLVLPGISGALMLVVLGLYKPLLESLSLIINCLINFKLPEVGLLMFILVFFVSFVIGIVYSSKIIKRFMNNKALVFESLINGMMIGSIINMFGIILLLERNIMEVIIGVIVYICLVVYLKLKKSII